MQFFGLSLFILILAAGPALASTTGAVGSPKVKADETALEMRAGFSTDDEEGSSDDSRFRSRVHIDHGFNDVYALRFIAAQDDRKGDNWEHDSLKIENRFYLLKAKDIGFDFGIRLGYQHKDGDKKPSNLEYGFYELIPFDPWEIRFNQIFSDALGDEAEDGIEAEWRTQISRKISEDGFRLGLEAFHDFGNLDEGTNFEEQSHTIGPVLKGPIFDGSFKFEAGYRAGISDSAPDHSFKFFLSRSF
ncbi:MAG: hypothetical protein LRZ85_00465 [Alphaproteobacteria bacterium]|nr:hypothetical protein [Alphaproteobacteria bacterium]MCD8526072.1 hypothetical protein [Alphaproteobacteria bacterium]MCD8570958.1 hypothetical protein [Alphaproteobacteria bacterium]